MTKVFVLIMIIQMSFGGGVSVATTEFEREGLCEDARDVFLAQNPVDISVPLFFAGCFETGRKASVPGGGGQ